MNIVIVGASSGIGAALTERLTSRGDRVFPLSRSKGHYFENYHQAYTVMDEIKESYRSIDALVVTAGDQAALGKLSECQWHEWHGAITANLLTAFNAIHLFYPMLKQSPKPRIICMSGGGATNGRPYFSSYAAAKTAVVRMVETMAEEEPNFHINAVAPGAVNTRMVDKLLAAGPAIIGQREYDRAFEQKKDGGDSMESALDLICFLLSDESDGISGKLISAKWDQWRSDQGRAALRTREIATLRRMT